MAAGRRCEVPFEAPLNNLPTLERVADPMNLFAAFRRARRGKRDRVSVARFELDLENELFGLRADLLASTYRPGPYRTFVVHDPVERRISAAPFRDRVVHQALCHVLEPVFEASFLPCSYACRRGKGTHAALRAASRGCRTMPWVLRADVRKFFASIDHEIQMSQLAELIADEKVLALCRKIVESSNPQEPVVDWFPGDDLFTPFERRRGLPIGNLTSQWFANLMLHGLDRAVTSRCAEGSYLRYMDDIVLFGESRQGLRASLESMACALDRLRLRFHPRKTCVGRTTDGFSFLGFRVFPRHRLLRGRSVRRARRRLRRLAAGFRAGEVGLPEVSRSVRAWVEHASHGDTWRLRSRIFRDVVFVREAGPGP